MKVPTVLTSRCVRKSAADWWAAGPGKLTPALFTRPASLAPASACLTCAPAALGPGPATGQPLGSVARLRRRSHHRPLVRDVKHDRRELLAQLLGKAVAVHQPAHAAEHSEAVLGQHPGRAAAYARGAARHHHRGLAWTGGRSHGSGCVTQSSPGVANLPVAAPKRHLRRAAGKAVLRRGLQAAPRAQAACVRDAEIPGGPHSALAVSPEHCSPGAMPKCPSLPSEPSKQAGQEPSGHKQTVNRCAPASLGGTQERGRRLLVAAAEDSRHRAARRIAGGALAGLGPRQRSTGQVRPARHPARPAPEPSRGLRQHKGRSASQAGGPPDGLGAPCLAAKVAGQLFGPWCRLQRRSTGQHPG